MHDGVRGPLLQSKQRLEVLRATGLGTLGAVSRGAFTEPTNFNFFSSFGAPLFIYSNYFLFIHLFISV